MQLTPMISVVMACYNREDFIGIAIESILNQTYTDFEFIIIDDCSTDNSAKIIESYANSDQRIKFIRNSANMHLIHNLREGFRQAKGKYIARMDDDDISLPTRFEKQIKYMEENPDIAVLGTFIELISKSKAESWVVASEPDKIAALMLFFNPMCHPTVMIRKSFLKSHNLNYSKEALYAEEYDLWKEVILKGGKLANLPEVLLKYRVHAKSITSGEATNKVQKQTAYRVKQELFNKYFGGKLSFKDFGYDIKYPFDNNPTRNILSAFDKIKKFPSSFIDNSSIEKLTNELCGRACTMDIVFSSDNDSAEQMYVAISSIILNSLPFEKFNFYIFNNGMSDKNIEKIKSLSDLNRSAVELLPINDAFFQSRQIPKQLSGFNKSFYRFFIPLLKPDLEKVLCFDCNIIVKDSLNKLWHTDLERNHAAAVEDFEDNSFDQQMSPPGHRTFNAGVLLINNRLWASENIVEQLLKNLSLLTDTNIEFSQQSVLNRTLGNKVKLVPPKYNLQESAYNEEHYTSYSRQDIESAKGCPAVVYFGGHVKPWHKSCSHPFRHEYVRYLAKAPYPLSHFRLKIITLPEKLLTFCYQKKYQTNTTKYKVFNITYKKEVKTDSFEQRYLLGIRYFNKHF